VFVCVDVRVNRFLAALAGLDNHVGELLDFGGFADVVKDCEGFQILRHTARRCRRFWINGVIEAEDLKKDIKCRYSDYL